MGVPEAFPGAIVSDEVGDDLQGLLDAGEAPELFGALDALADLLDGALDDAGACGPAAAAERGVVEAGSIGAEVLEVGGEDAAALSVSLAARRLPEPTPWMGRPPGRRSGRTWDQSVRRQEATEGAMI